MPDITNGVAASAPPPVRWRKSRRSNQGGNCVEFAVLPEDSGIAVRNSRNPERTGVDLHSRRDRRLHPRRPRRRFRRLIR